MKRKIGWIIKIKANTRYRHFTVSRSRLETSTEVMFFFFRLNETMRQATGRCQ